MSDRQEYEARIAEAQARYAAAIERGETHGVAQARLDRTLQALERRYAHVLKATGFVAPPDANEEIEAQGVMVFASPPGGDPSQRSGVVVEVFAKDCELILDVLAEQPRPEWVEELRSRFKAALAATKGELHGEEEATGR